MATKLTSPQGSTVSVDDSRVDALLAAGYTKQSSKTSSKKTASAKSEDK